MISIAETQHDTLALGQAYHNLGKSQLDQFKAKIAEHPSKATEKMLLEANSHFTKAARFFNQVNAEGALASAYRNLSNVQLAMQQDAMAEEFLQKALHALGNRVDIQARLFTIRTQLSIFLRKGNEQEALSLMDSLIRITRKSCEINFPILSEKEKGNYLEIYLNEVNRYANLSLEMHSKQPEMAGNLFNLVLSTKGFLLRTGNQIRSIAQNSGDTELEKLFQEWTKTTEALAAASAKGENEKLLREKAEELERKMSEKSSAIRDLYTWENTKWQDIKARLRKDEAAIEFTTLTRSNAKEFDPHQKEILLAIIIRKDAPQPILVEMHGLQEMNDAIQNAGSSNNKSIDQLYALEDWKNNPFRKYLWSQLEPHVKKCKRIFVSPDGILHRIALSAVPLSSKKRICDIMEIRMVNSTANVLVDNDYRIQPQDNALLFGGIDYASDEGSSKT